MTEGKPNHTKRILYIDTNNVISRIYVLYRVRLKMFQNILMFVRPRRNVIRIYDFVIYMCVFVSTPRRHLFIVIVDVLILFWHVKSPSKTCVVYILYSHTYTHAHRRRVYLNVNMCRYVAKSFWRRSFHRLRIARISFEPAFVSFFINFRWRHTHAHTSAVAVSAWISY